MIDPIGHKPKTNVRWTFKMHADVNRTSVGRPLDDQCVPREIYVVPFIANHCLVLAKITLSNTIDSHR